MSDDTCGSCQTPFQRECSKVREIIVQNFSSVEGQQQEEIISINEALSVIFEIPPLTPNERREEIGASQTKKEIFKKGSRFVSNNDAPTESDFAVCVQCSEKLKDLYSCFHKFISVCKLESQIGQILQSLGKDISTARSGGNGVVQWKQVGETEGDRNNFTFSLRVKTEPPESEGEQELEGQEEERDDDDDDLLNNDDDHAAASPCGSPLSISIDAVEGYPSTTRNIKQSPPESENDNPESDESENEEGQSKNNENEEAPKPPQKISVKLADGLGGAITQLKCPKCNKQFLHENTLICHRRIIHRENIKIHPPTPLLPALKLNKEGNAQRLKALADANGLTSACPICRAEVPRTDIRNHLSIHTRSISNPWLCTICGKNFNSQTGLQEHSKIHISGIPCKRCGKRVPTLNMLTHIRQCMSLPSGSGKSALDFSCKVCSKMFRTREKLLEHRSRVHAHFWKCKLCGIKFVERKKMQKHMNTHKQKKGRKCKICDKSFDRIDVLRLHIKRFHRNNEGPATPAPLSPPPDHDDPPSPLDNDPFSDTEQNQFTASTPVQRKVQTFKKKMIRGPYKKKKLPMPKKVNASKTAVDPENPDASAPNQEDRFICKGCPQRFPKAIDLDAHLLEVHTDQDSFLCKICNRKLQDDYCLKLHVKTHGEMKPMECCHPGCDKVYRDRNTFFYHLKEKHSMDSKSIVEKYPEVFRQRNRDYSTRAFCRNIGQVAKEKGEYPCEVCGRVFTQIYGLRSHVKLVHDKVKDFLCKYCGKAFARKSYFLLHEKLHTTNESPYKCHLCSKGFRLPGNLRVHLKSTIHNPNKDYVCDICGKGFNRNDNLRLHVKTVHLKIPTRKPKSEASDRYTHGGRRRVYVEEAEVPIENESDDYKPNVSPGDETSTRTAGPLPETSQSFFNPQNELHSTSQLSGDDGASADSSNQHQHQDAAHLSALSMPTLQLHHLQNVRSSSDAAAGGSSSGEHHTFPGYHFRGFQYR